MKIQQSLEEGKTLLLLLIISLGFGYFFNDDLLFLMNNLLSCHFVSLFIKIETMSFGGTGTVWGELNSLSENIMAVKIWFNRLNLWLIEWQVSQLFEVVRREVWMLLPFTNSNKPLKYYTTQLLFTSGKDH